MRRGLKCYFRAAGYKCGLNFTHCPDEEGTEINARLVKISFAFIATSLIAPMRRGLKYRCATASASSSTAGDFTHCPDEEGTEINPLSPAPRTTFRNFTHCPDEEGTEIAQP